ncbi:Lsr2 family protein [Pseudonocardia nematodicida]|uniref:Lsr2 family protein n=1 Tax=Pseudonocardia nematodicida TaxID=1206997 RepID=A0ABV1K468_9PSEU
MALLHTVRLVDDLTGEEADETVSFALDGRHFEIDLSRNHAARLRDSLAPFVGSARRGAPRGTAAPSSSRRHDHGVRAWARRNGFVVSDRGRIPAEVVTAYRNSPRAP